MKERRDKKLWDKISTVYEFHRDKNKLALYSNLHEWVLENRPSEEGEALLEVHTEASEQGSSSGNDRVETSVV